MKGAHCPLKLPVVISRLQYKACKGGVPVRVCVNDMFKVNEIYHHPPDCS